MNNFYDFDFSDYGHFSFRQYTKLIFRYFVIIIANLPLMQKTPNDILDFLTKAYREAFQYKMPYRYILFYKFFGKLIKIFEWNGLRAGFACFRVGPKDNIHLDQFVILGNFRGRGLGKAFLSNCLKYYKEKGFVTCSLHTNLNNFIALKVFKSLGFIQAKIRGNGKVSTLIYMTRDL